MTIQQFLEKAMAPHSSTLAQKNPTDGGAWQAAVHGVAKSQTRLSIFIFIFHFHALEKEMATHSSVLARTIPGKGGAWWAAVYGVAQSQTRLKRLSSSSSSSRVHLGISGVIQFISSHKNLSLQSFQLGQVSATCWFKNISSNIS